MFGYQRDIHSFRDSGIFFQEQITQNHFWRDRRKINIWVFVTHKKFMAYGD